MPSYKTIAFTTLELKALWLCADIGYQMPNPDLEKDPLLEAAAEVALDKVWRTQKGMPRKGHPPGHHRGPEIDLRSA